MSPIFLIFRGRKNGDPDIPNIPEVGGRENWGRRGQPTRDHRAFTTTPPPLPAPAVCQSKNNSGKQHSLRLFLFFFQFRYPNNKSIKQHPLRSVFSNSIKKNNPPLCSVFEILIKVFQTEGFSNGSRKKICTRNIKPL